MRHWIKQIAFMTSIACLTNQVYAMGEGLYLGLMAGPAQVDVTSQDAIGFTTNTIPPIAVEIPVTPKKNQFGGRLYLGYKFNPYAGIESGFAVFSAINFKPTGTIPSNVDLCSNPETQLGLWDISGLLSAPFGPLSVFVKGGLSITFERTTSLFSNSKHPSCGSSKNNVSYKPAVAIGASYDLSQNWALDVSITRYQLKEPVKSIDFLGIGFSYHFVDVYCGQLLC